MKIRNTTEWVEVKQMVTIFASMWKSLPDHLKNIWELYASWLGSAHEVEQAGRVSYANCPVESNSWQPKRCKGSAAFIGANITAFKSGLTIPRLNPPLG